MQQPRFGAVLLLRRWPVSVQLTVCGCGRCGWPCDSTAIACGVPAHICGKCYLVRRSKTDGWPVWVLLSALLLHLMYVHMATCTVCCICTYTHICAQCWSQCTAMPGGLRCGSAYELDGMPGYLTCLCTGWLASWYRLELASWCWLASWYRLVHRAA